MNDAAAAPAEAAPADDYSFHHHIITTKEYGYQIPNPNAVANICYGLFFPKNKKTIPERIENVRELGPALVTAVLNGNSSDLEKSYRITFMAIRMTTARGAFELVFEVSRAGQIYNIKQIMIPLDEYQQREFLVASTHVDMFEKLENKNRGVAFTTAVWRYKTSEQMNATLGTLYVPPNADGTVKLRSVNSSPAEALEEPQDFNRQAYEFSDAPTKISRNGQVLFAAATPHAAQPISRIFSEFKSSGIKARFNIMFFVQPKTSMTPRLFRIKTGRPDSPRWRRGADGKWEQRPLPATPTGQGESSDMEVATHFKTNTLLRF